MRPRGERAQRSPSRVWSREIWVIWHWDGISRTPGSAGAGEWSTYTAYPCLLGFLQCSRQRELLWGTLLVEPGEPAVWPSSRVQRCHICLMMLGTGESLRPAQFQGEKTGLPPSRGGAWPGHFAKNVWDRDEHYSCLGETQFATVELAVGSSRVTKSWTWWVWGALGLWRYKG